MVLPWGTASVFGLLVIGQGVAGATIKSHKNTPWKQRLLERAEQFRGPARPYVANPSRAAAVKQTFDISWDGYYTYAFPHDSLRPVNNSWDDDRYVIKEISVTSSPLYIVLTNHLRNGWGASAVDALSTALIMGDSRAVAEILDYIPQINFDNTTSGVSLFETTIRYLGGLISGISHQSVPTQSRY